MIQAALHDSSTLEDDHGVIVCAATLTPLHRTRPVIAALLAFVLAACAGGDEPPSKPESDSASQGGNEYDRDPRDQAGDAAPAPDPPSDLKDFTGEPPPDFGSGTYAGDLLMPPSSGATDARRDPSPAGTEDAGTPDSSERENPDGGFQLCRPRLACAEGSSCRSVACTGNVRAVYECQCRGGRYDCTQMACM